MMKQLIKYLLLAAGGVALFLVTNQAETARRGYQAIGGEALLILLPVMYALLARTAKDMVREIRRVIRECTEREERAGHTRHEP